MACTRYAESFVKPARRDGVTDRHTYLQTAASYAKRGQELPQTKLLDLDVAAIRSAVRQRESLKKYIKENLSNEALAKQFGVHHRTIERAIAYETHTLVG